MADLRWGGCTFNFKQFSGKMAKITSLRSHFWGCYLLWKILDPPLVRLSFNFQDKNICHQAGKDLSVSYEEMKNSIFVSCSVKKGPFSHPNKNLSKCGENGPFSGIIMEFISMHSTRPSRLVDISYFLSCTSCLPFPLQQMWYSQKQTDKLNARKSATKHFSKDFYLVGID